MRVWLTRDNKTTTDIYVWPEDKKPVWNSYFDEWHGPEGAIVAVLCLHISFIDSMPACLRRGGRKAIVLRDLQFLDCVE